ncbi:MAG: heavy metal translocating P-type ATPase [Nitrospirae bacterium]|nr:heavy metal translocating P-type ATPase [Nitrospirota bacterium]
MESHLRKRCSHCLIEINAEPPVTDEEGNPFCCQGCLGVYRILRSEGLEEFYKRRSDWHPGTPEFVSVEAGRFERLVRRENAHSVLELTLSGIRCASCIWLIERYLGRADGIIEVRVNYATHVARIVFDHAKITVGEILQRISRLGYVPRPELKGTSSGLLKEEARGLLIRFGTGAFFSMQIMLLSVALYAGYFQDITQYYRRAFQLISWALATPVILYAGYPFIKGTITGIKRGFLNMDTLVTLGAVSAYLFSIVMIFRGGEVYFDSAAMIITIILLGRYIETVSKTRASRVVSMLTELVPESVRVVTSGGTKKTLIDHLRKGDHVEILPGERIPVDGVVIEGETEVEESMLTGEARPVKKQKGDDVYAATINLSSPIRVEVRATGEETLLNTIIRTVQEAQTRKAPVQKIADRVSRYFVLLVTMFASITFIYWYQRASIDVALINTVSVLVVACPCALGIATPLAILIGSQVASTRGIVIKGGDVIERLSRATHILLDKTGTLTSGRFSLEETIFFGNRDTALMIARGMESLSSHPVARTLSSGDSAHDVDIKEHRTIPGRGIYAVVNGRQCYLGNLDMLKETVMEIPEGIISLHNDMTERGRCLVFLVVDGKIEAVFILSDALREHAERLIRELKLIGIVPWIVSGDTEDVVREVARKVGVDRWYSSVQPPEKSKIVRELKAQGYSVVMVGDGINDAPALIEADTGISVGRATDIALESADVVIIRPELLLIKDIHILSKRVMRTIKQNLFWAFSYNIITIPLAMAGRIHPIVSAILMVTSSLVVVGSSLRLMKFKRS